MTVYADAFLSGLRPDPLRTVSEWADQRRFLSQKASAEPGRWRTSRTPYLREIMDSLSSSSPIQRVVFIAGAQIGKALSLDTPIPTPCGWKTMGDLKLGDKLFDESGKPCKVTFATAVMEKRVCYEVCFSDGQKITADAEHQWTVDVSANGNACGTATMTTEQMLKIYKSCS